MNGGLVDDLLNSVNLFSECFCLLASIKRLSLALLKPENVEFRFSTGDVRFSVSLRVSDVSKTF